MDQIGVYDGSDTPKWATFGPPANGVWLRTPIGETFSGDLDVEGTSATGPVRLHLGGLRVAVHPQDNIAEPIGGVRKVLKERGNPAVDGNPFEHGGPLHCSNILLLAPQVAEARLQLEGYALSWRWLTSTSANMGTSDPVARAPSTGWITNTAVGMQRRADPVRRQPGEPARRPDAHPARRTARRPDRTAVPSGS